MLRNLLITGSLMLLTGLAHASDYQLPKCGVNSLKDAQKCIDKVALAMPEFEEPNEGLVSADKTVVLKLLKALGINSVKKVKLVKDADFIGAVLSHGDEHTVNYFAIVKGSKQEVLEIFQLDLVDLASNLEESIIPSDVFLGEDAALYDVEEDIKYAIEEFDKK